MAKAKKGAAKRKPAKKTVAKRPTAKRAAPKRVAAKRSRASHGPHARGRRGKALKSFSVGDAKTGVLLGNHRISPGSRIRVTENGHTIAYNVGGFRKRGNPSGGGHHRQSARAHAASMRNLRKAQAALFRKYSRR